MQRFWITADLRARGKSDRAIAAAGRAGLLHPVRQGWWAVPGTPDELVRAVRVGGVATAHSAARARGLWTPPDAVTAVDHASRTSAPMLRVAVRRTSSSSRLLDPDDSLAPLGGRPDVSLSWTSPADVARARRFGMLPVLLMLRDLFLDDEPERALAVVDSALRERHLQESELPALAALLPARLAHLPALADASAQSGTETIVRVRLRAAGLRVVPQAPVRGMGHGDLLVEDRVLVELDGRRWHDDPARFEEDRRRDLVATTSRYRVLRFSWYQVLFAWPAVEAAIRAALALS